MHLLVFLSTPEYICTTHQMTTSRLTPPSFSNSCENFLSKGPSDYTIFFVCHSFYFILFGRPCTITVRVFGCLLPGRGSRVRPRARVRKSRRLRDATLHDPVAAGRVFGPGAFRELGEHNRWLLLEPQQYLVPLDGDTCTTHV